MIVYKTNFTLTSGMKQYQRVQSKRKMRQILVRSKLEVIKVPHTKYDSRELGPDDQSLTQRLKLK